MRRFLCIAVAFCALILGTATYASAGSPHFVGTPKVSVSGDTLTVTGKEAGLGNETQVHIELSADAQCVNKGGNHPQAGNKETFSTAGDFPVQNGRANFELSVTASFQPDCSPPMSVVWFNVVISDSEHGLSEVLIP